MINIVNLKHFSPFDSLSDEYLHRALSKAQLRVYNKGEIIFQRGKPQLDNFYLFKGIVELEAADQSRGSINHASNRAKRALNTTQPSRISVRAKTEVMVFAIERDFVDLVMAWSETSVIEPLAPANSIVVNDEHSDWMSVLLSSPLFARVPPGNIQTLFQRFIPRIVIEGEDVVRLGSSGDFFYVVKAGVAEVLDAEGRCQAVLKAGDYFGEEALIGDTTRNATVRMRGEGELMCLGKESFNELLHQPVVDYLTLDEYFNLFKSTQPARIIDVRLATEYEQERLPDSVNMPLATLRQQLLQLDKTQSYIISDSAGRRAEVAVQLMVQAGLNVKMLSSADITEVEL